MADQYLPGSKDRMQLCQGNGKSLREYELIKFHNHHHFQAKEPVFGIYSLTLLYARIIDKGKGVGWTWWVCYQGTG